VKWIKHLTNASEDIKIKLLEEQFGNDGYAVFFKLLEKVGKEGERCCLSFETYPVKTMAKDFNVDEKTLLAILGKMAKLGLISAKIFEKRNEIYIPNLKKYGDEYTTRGKKYYEEQQLRKFPKEDYIKVEQAYVKLKKVNLQGNEWLPLLSEVKLMFRSGRTPEQIIKCMKWMSEDSFYRNKWTMATIRKKIPEVLGGAFEEEVVQPNYARN
jgi:hypothetical protein